MGLFHLAAEGGENVVLGEVRGDLEERDRVGERHPHGGGNEVSVGVSILVVGAAVAFLPSLIEVLRGKAAAARDEVDVAPERPMLPEFPAVEACGVAGVADGDVAFGDPSDLGLGPDDAGALDETAQTRIGASGG